MLIYNSLFKYNNRLNDAHKQHRSLLTSVGKMVRTNFTLHFTDIIQSVRTAATHTNDCNFNCSLLTKHNIATVCTAIELIHIASLIHDDIIDNSSKRRGFQTLHCQTDTKTATLVGDALIVRSIHILDNMQNVSQGVKYSLTQVVLKQINNLIVGEMSGISLKKPLPLTELVMQYNAIVNKKTSSMFTLGVQMVCILATTGQQNSYHTATAFNVNNTPYDLTNISLAFGIAFQIKDDMSDWQHCYNATTVAVSNKNKTSLTLNTFKKHNKVALKELYADLKNKETNFPIILLNEHEPKLISSSISILQKTTDGSEQFNHQILKIKQAFIKYDIWNKCNKYIDKEIQNINTTINIFYSNFIGEQKVNNQNNCNNTPFCNFCNYILQ